MNRGGASALNLEVATVDDSFLFQDLAPYVKMANSFVRELVYTLQPKYLPVSALQPDAEVTYTVKRDYGRDDQDVMIFRWSDESDTLHESRQSITWRWIGPKKRQNYWTEFAEYMSRYGAALFTL